MATDNFNDKASAQPDFLLYELAFRSPADFGSVGLVICKLEGEGKTAEALGYARANLPHAQASGHEDDLVNANLAYIQAVYNHSDSLRNNDQRREFLAEEIQFSSRFAPDLKGILSRFMDGLDRLEENSTDLMSAQKLDFGMDNNSV